MNHNNILGWGILIIFILAGITSFVLKIDPIEWVIRHTTLEGLFVFVAILFFFAGRESLKKDKY